MIRINNTLYNFRSSSQIYKYDSINDTWISASSDFTNIPGVIQGDTLWTDGTDIYCQTANNKISILDQSTLTWGTPQTVVTTANNGYMYWTDGTDVYYSSSTTHKVWDKANKNWVNKTWSGLTNFGGNEVFYYNDEIYARQAASPYNIYKLDKATSTWTQAYTNPMGSNSNFRGARMWDLGGRSTAHTTPWLTGLRRANK